MRSRLLATLIPLACALQGALLASLVLAPAAGAFNDGRGFYGATSDKTIVDTGFILVIFFPTFVFLMSMLQGHLEKRKDARKAAQKALLSNSQWRGGW
jgi:preprotein translocase subunit SecG